MTGRLLRAGIAFGLTLAQPGVALADAPPAPLATDAAPDVERLVLARQIVAIALPPERMTIFINNLVDAALGQIHEQTVDAVHTSDAGLLAIFSDFDTTATESARMMMLQTAPGLSDALARAYAHEFSREDLRQILIFGQTAAGAKYLSRAHELMHDPEVQSYLNVLHFALLSNEAPMVTDLKSKVWTYLSAHPDVAKAMNKPK